MQIWCQIQLSHEISQQILEPEHHKNHSFLFFSIPKAEYIL